MEFLTVLTRLCVFPPPKLHSLLQESTKSTGMEEPATSIQPKNRLPGVGNEVRTGLGGLGTWKRVHQDASVEEYPQRAAEADRQVLQTPADAHMHTHINAYMFRQNEMVPYIQKSRHLPAVMLNLSPPSGLPYPRFSKLWFAEQLLSVRGRLSQCPSPSDHPRG